MPTVYVSLAGSFITSECSRPWKYREKRGCFTETHLPPPPVCRLVACSLHSLGVVIKRIAGVSGYDAPGYCPHFVQIERERDKDIELGRKPCKLICAWQSHRPRFSMSFQFHSLLLFIFILFFLFITWLSVFLILRDQHHQLAPSLSRMNTATFALIVSQNVNSFCLALETLTQRHVAAQFALLLP